MTNQFKTAFASLAVASLCTLGASSQASASDLLDAMLSGGKVVSEARSSLGIVMPRIPMPPARNKVRRATALFRKLWQDEFFIASI